MLLQFCRRENIFSPMSQEIVVFRLHSMRFALLFTALMGNKG